MPTRNVVRTQWKPGTDPEVSPQNWLGRTGSAGFQPASRAGGSMPPGARPAALVPKGSSLMHRWTAGSERALGPARTPPTRHRAGSAASRLKAGAPSGRRASETAVISSAGFPSESRSKPLLTGTFIWGHLRDGPRFPEISGNHGDQLADPDQC